MRIARLAALSLVSLVAIPVASCKSSKPPAPAAAPSPFADVPTTSTLQLANLSGPVDVVRDAHGMTHVFATTITDALRVEAYQIGRDRTAQVELIRRDAEGKLAELFGNVDGSFIDGDIAMRQVGLYRAAQEMYAALDPKSEAKAWLDAYADGLTQFNARIQSGAESYPSAMFAFPPTAFAPWTGADVLAVARLQEWNLAYDAQDEIDNSTFIAASRGVFNAQAAAPLDAARAGFLTDFVRFAPLDATTVLPGFPGATTGTSAYLRPAATRPAITPWTMDPAPLRAASGFSSAIKRVHSNFARDHFGSNDFVVGPKLSANGHALLENDPHLALGAPSTFYAVQLHVTSDDPTQSLDVTGMAFPGLVGIILGFNDSVAWGATDAYYDIGDVYQETLTPDGKSVVFNGQNVPLQIVHEEIAVSGAAPLEYDLPVVPHHGPLVPTIVNHAIAPIDPTQKQLSIRWTGAQATQEVETLVGLWRSKTVGDAMTAMAGFAVGAENWVFADTSGGIAYTSHAIIPTRDKRAFTWDTATFTGTLPCFVEPGDGTAEWTGQILDEYIPQALNPAAGFVVTANNDQVGTTLGDDPSSGVLPNGQPVFLQCFYDPGLRAGRITRDIQTEGHPLALADLATIQNDARSNLAPLVVPGIVAAIGRAQAEAQTPGTHPDLTSIVSDPRFAAANAASIAALFTQWGAAAAYDTPAGVSLDDGSLSADATEAASSEATLLWNGWLVSMLHEVFDDELAEIGQAAPPFRMDPRQSLVFLFTAPDPTKLATYDATSKDSAIWDDMRTTPVESRDNRTIAALLDAIDIAKKALGADTTQWRWGKMHTVTFASLVSLWGQLSIPQTGDPTFPSGFPRHGELWTVDVGEWDEFPDPKAAGFSFAYTNGPVQRFVIDMDPVAGPTAMNALPGGEVWDDASPHFRDEAELWRRNQNHPVPTTHDPIAKGADEHLVYSP